MDNELKKKEVYYLSKSDGPKTTEYRFFKFKDGWHFIITYSFSDSPAPSHSVEFDLPKDIIPTLLTDKLDECFGQ